MIRALGFPDTRTEPSYPCRQAPALPDPNAPLFAFSFKQPWLGVFTVPKNKFVLRVEHMAELTRLAREFNKYRPSGEDAVGMSDVLNAALDFVLSHPMSFTDIEKQEQMRERMAEVAYRRAFLRFLRHENL
jgi:hypothetical protein